LPKYKNALTVRRSRLLRKNSTDAERIIWSHLRNKRMMGVKFRREQPFGRYIVDFISFSNKLVIEIDGGQHARQKEKDKVRDRFIRQAGFRILRFWNNEVLQNREAVLEVIRRALLESTEE
jgi:very-short-patch-repair endonuclease